MITLPEGIKESYVEDGISFEISLENEEARAGIKSREHSWEMHHHPQKHRDMRESTSEEEDGTSVVLIPHIWRWNRDLSTVWSCRAQLRLI